MTLMIAVATREGIVLSADSRAVERVLDSKGRVMSQRPFVSEKIWLIQSAIGVASCGTSSLDVPRVMATLQRRSRTLRGCARELLVALRAGVVDQQPWVLYVVGREQGVPTLLRITVPNATVSSLSQGLAPLYRGWAEGVEAPIMPNDTRAWSCARARAFAQAAICAASQGHPDCVGPPVRSVLVSSRGARWLPESQC
jgi:hypothetical protein